MKKERNFFLVKNQIGFDFALKRSASNVIETVAATEQALPRKRAFPNNGNYWTAKQNKRFCNHVLPNLHVTDPYTYTDHNTRLIQTKAEPLRNKQIFTKYTSTQKKQLILIY